VALAAFLGAIVGILGTLAAGPSGPAAQQPATAAPTTRMAVLPEKSPKTGLPYSPGILAGNTLYISGHLGRDPMTAKLVPGGFDAEARQSLANIREVLLKAGMDFKNVTTVTAYIVDFKEFAAFNKIYREYFQEPLPARATVQVAALNDGARIELQMIAVK
jgi:2-iminobutanoate/2-iminopropanoate deaminase